MSKMLSLESGPIALVLDHHPIDIACCLRAPKGSPSIPSDNVPELTEQEDKIMLERNNSFIIEMKF